MNGRMNYDVYITRKDDVFIAEVPALPGCRTMGRTEKEALENIRDVIEGYYQTLKKTRRPLPKVKVIKMTNEYPAVRSSH